LLAASPAGVNGGSLPSGGSTTMDVCLVGAPVEVQNRL
jgi:hypothetical protein